jgi:hypothetical protein
VEGTSPTTTTTPTGGMTERCVAALWARRLRDGETSGMLATAV